MTDWKSRADEIAEPGRGAGRADAVTAGPPAEPPILTTEEVAEIRSRDLMDPLWPGLTESDWAQDAFRLADSHDALRARLRDAEETLRYYARTEGHPVSGAKGWDSGQVARAYFERHADPQEPA